MAAIKYEYLPRYKIDDYKRWEGEWELIKGVPFAMAPSPVKKHQQIIFIMAKEMDNNLECENCEVTIDTDYIIDDETVLRSDVALICDDDSEKITKTPEIVVEVVSPSTLHKDLNLKFELYEEEKVKYYIIIFPNELIAKVYRLHGKNYEKVGTFREEQVEFDIKCPLRINFNNVFEKFKEKK
ncbi:Uma2 family endonuclease [Nautilia sp.]